MKYNIFFLLFLSIQIALCQDKIVLTNDDTLSVKILKYNDDLVDYQLAGESLTNSLSTSYINSIILESGRTITPSMSAAKKINPVFGKFKGRSIVTNNKETYGMKRVGEAFYRFKSADDMIRQLEFAGQMMGASLVIMPERTDFLNNTGTAAEFFSFMNVKSNFLQTQLIGRNFELAALNHHAINQLLIIDELQSGTLNHKLSFTEDGKILENGKENGSYKLTGEGVEITYSYTNKKGKTKEWKGTYKVGSYDRDYILLFSANDKLSFFYNIVLKRLQ